MQDGNNLNRAIVYPLEEYPPVADPETKLRSCLHSPDFAYACSGVLFDASNDVVLHAKLIKRGFAMVGNGHLGRAIQPEATHHRTASPRLPAVNEDMQVDASGGDGPPFVVLRPASRPDGVERPAAVGYDGTPGQPLDGSLWVGGLLIVRGVGLAQGVVLHWRGRPARLKVPVQTIRCTVRRRSGR